MASICYCIDVISSTNVKILLGLRNCLMWKYVLYLTWIFVYIFRIMLLNFEVYPLNFMSSSLSCSSFIKLYVWVGSPELLREKFWDHLGNKQLLLNRFSHSVFGLVCCYTCCRIWKRLRTLSRVFSFSDYIYKSFWSLLCISEIIYNC